VLAGLLKGGKWSLVWTSDAEFSTRAMVGEFASVDGTIWDEPDELQATTHGKIAGK